MTRRNTLLWRSPSPFIRRIRRLWSRRTAWIAALIGGATVVVSCAPPEARTPAQAVAQLYAMLDALGVRTVPDSLSLQALRPFLSDSLAGALASADQERQAGVRSAPTAKAVWADGDPFSSLFEGRSSSRSDTVVMTGDTALVVVAFSNSTLRPVVNWRDTVVVTRERGRFVVADIRYGMASEFGFTGRLLENLH